MEPNSGQGRDDAEFLLRVVARMRPLIRGKELRLSRLDRVIGALPSAPADLRESLQRELRRVGVVIVDDTSQPDIHPAGAQGAAAALGPKKKGAEAARESDPTRDASDQSAPVDAQRAIDAARRRLAADRTVRRPEKSVLTAEEEIGLALLLRGPSGGSLAPGELAKLSGEARRAADAFLRHNHGLVHSIARHYQPVGMEYEDLVQHGMVGLMRAVEMFDPLQGNKFSTYATWWVRQSITRGIANEARMIRIPVHMAERVAKVWATRNKLTVNGAPPRLHTLALACGLTDEQVRECLVIGPPRDLVSLDQHVGDDSESTLGDLLDLEDNEPGAFEHLALALLQEHLHQVLDTLSERQAAIISMRFGLNDGEPKTLDEIGQVHGVTRERIRQIEKKALEMLRDPDRNEVLRGYLDGDIRGL